MQEEEMKKQELQADTVAKHCLLPGEQSRGLIYLASPGITVSCSSSAFNLLPCVAFVTCEANCGGGRGMKHWFALITASTFFF
ncbi:hypothetical protein E2C01_065738 [Portunus trituberculatus]|uniref:Uncharacterized protein n=1 Tax=Portunus trituberculatus TaxID=210409 RepID=A0A5B7HGC9_PORTR|nr:hypothetical protein [Portunus trituberculatus]